MPYYRYRARNMEGRLCTGRMDVQTEQELFKRLEEEGMHCFSFRKEAAEPVAGRLSLGASILAPLCRELSVMLAAGIPLTEALEVSGQMAGSRRLKQELFRLREEVCRGLSLSQAMEAGGGTFPPLLVYMVRAGEAGGGLDGILKRMAEYYERQRELNGRIRTAMSYPMILLAVTAFVCIFLVSEVLPQFTSLLEGQPLPWLTRIFLGMGDYLANHGSVLLLSVLVLTILTAGIFKISSVRLAADRVLLYIPIVGKLLKTIDAARFAQTFGIVYGSGAGILEALELAGEVMGNTYIQKAIESLEEEIQRGSLLSRSLQREDIFPPVFVSLTAAGEEAGSLEQAMEAAGIYYEKETERAVSQMAALLEPAMILFMSAVVGSMVLSVMTPVFQMYSSML